MGGGGTASTHAHTHAHTRASRRGRFAPAPRRGNRQQQLTPSRPGPPAAWMFQKDRYRRSAAWWGNCRGGWLWRAVEKMCRKVWKFRENVVTLPAQTSKSNQYGRKKTGNALFFAG